MNAFAMQWTKIAEKIPGAVFFQAVDGDGREIEGRGTIGLYMDGYRGAYQPRFSIAPALHVWADKYGQNSGRIEVSGVHVRDEKGQTIEPYRDNARLTPGKIGVSGKDVDRTAKDIIRRLIPDYATYCRAALETRREYDAKNASRRKTLRDLCNRTGMTMHPQNTEENSASRRFARHKRDYSSVPEISARLNYEGSIIELDLDNIPAELAIKIAVTACNAIATYQAEHPDPDTPTPEEEAELDRIAEELQNDNVRA